MHDFLREFIVTAENERKRNQINELRSHESADETTQRFS